MTATTTRVLVVEDEPDLREAVAGFLGMEGMIADAVGSLAAADTRLRAGHYDVLVLDLGLPDGDGLVWLEAHPEVRERGVVITTARGEDLNRISGARAGADAYLVKPVLLEELTLVIRNLARRLGPGVSRPWTLSAVQWTIESPEGRRVRLTHSEHTLLNALAEMQGRPVSRDAIIIALGHDPEAYDGRRLEILVRRLRAKVRDLLGYPLPLDTVHRLGYAFTASIAVR